MLSRHAESFFWLSRNIERAETVARLVDVCATRSMDADAEPVWEAGLWDTASAVGVCTVRPAPVSARDALVHCVFDPANPSSIVSTVSVARTNAIDLRVELSTEMWEQINSLYLDVGAYAASDAGAETTTRLLRVVRDRCQAIAGVADATLLHVDGWNFLQVGRFLERAGLIVRMLATVPSLDAPWPAWQRLLHMCCASHPFAQTSTQLPAPRDVAGFLLFHPAFPRSVRRCLDEVDRSLHGLSQTVAGTTFVNDAQKQAGRLRATFAFADVDDVLAEGLPAFLARTGSSLRALGGAIQRDYFPSLPTSLPMRSSEPV